MPFFHIHSFFSRLPLRTKTTAAIGLTGTLIAGVSIFLFFMKSAFLLHQDFNRNLTLSIALLESRCLLALYKGDPGTFVFPSDLQPSVSAMALHLPDGSPFVSWNRNPANVFPWETFLHRNPPEQKATIRSGELHPILEIRDQGKIQGILSLQMDFSSYRNRLALHALFALLLFLGSSVSAFFLSLYFRRILLMPIFKLVHTVKKTIRQQEATIPPTLDVSDELNLLISEFNHLLQEIEGKKNALAHHRSRLQDEVVRRTMALMAANTKLAHLNMALREAKKRDHLLLKRSETLEGQVVERTVALTQANTRLTRLNMELREAKKRADDASFAKSTFLASMSHELRTPLNGILGYAQLLHRNGDYLNPKDQERIHIIRQCGEHLLRMINDILDLSKIEAGKMDLVLQPFRISSFVQSTAGMARTRAKDKGLSLEISMAENLPVTVLGDEHRLRQVLLNLLGNAIKFTERGSIQMDVQMAGDRVLFEVSDTGMGIPEKDLPLIFKPFSQADSIRKKPEGTGLGLSISQYLVRMMGGCIQVESRMGSGSRFWFAIPLPQSGEGSESSMETCCDHIISYKRTDEEKSPLRILLVDDVKENRGFLTDILSPLGFDVDEAGDGEEALRLCMEKKPDIVLMDLVMPGMDGFETIEKIQLVFSMIPPPVIAVSASATPNVIEKCMKAGCVSFISKPVHIPKLFELLCKTLPMVWISERPSRSFPTESSLVSIPDSAAMEKLEDAVSRGDISAIENWCDSEQAMMYPDFTRHVKNLATAFQIRELSLWLEAIPKKQKEQNAL